MKIPIYRYGELADHAIVDKCDSHLTKRRWGLWTNGRQKYAQAWIDGKNVFMHALILGKKGFVTDHINGDGLDNRRSNLRSTDRATNRINTTTGKRGVYNRGRRWVAQLRIGGKLLNLGSFETYSLALVARVQAEKQHGY